MGKFWKRQLQMSMFFADFLQDKDVRQIVDNPKFGRGLPTIVPNAMGEDTAYDIIATLESDRIKAKIARKRIDCFYFLDFNAPEEDYQLGRQTLTSLYQSIHADFGSSFNRISYVVELFKKTDSTKQFEKIFNRQLVGQVVEGDTVEMGAKFIARSSCDFGGRQFNINDHLSVKFPEGFQITNDEYAQGVTITRDFNTDHNKVEAYKGAFSAETFTYLVKYAESHLNIAELEAGFYGDKHQ